MKPILNKRILITEGILEYHDLLASKKDKVVAGVPEFTSEEELWAAVQANIINQVRAMFGFRHSASERELLSAFIEDKDRTQRERYGLPETASEEELRQAILEAAVKIISDENWQTDQVALESDETWFPMVRPGGNGNYMN